MNLPDPPLTAGMLALDDGMPFGLVVWKYPLR